MRMKARLAAAAALLSLASFAASPAAAQLIYTNAGLNPQATAENGTAAAPGFFWSEMQHDVGNLTEANTTLGFGATQGSNRLADDFTVPAGSSGWIISQVVLYGYKTGAPATPSPFSAYTLQIWGPCTAGTRPGDAGCTTIAWGDTTTNRLASSVDSTWFRIANSLVPAPTAPGTTRKIWTNTLTVGTTLGPGLYWLDWASTDTSAGTHFDPPATVAGVRGVAGWNARQFTVSAGTWANALDTGTPATAPDVPMDLPFQLIGTTPVELQSFSAD